MFGVVNVITRSGTGLTGVEAAAAYGSEAAGKARLSYGRKLDDGDLLFTGTWGESDGDDHLSCRSYDDPARAWVSTDFDGDRAARLFALGRFGGLSVQGIYSRRTKNVPTAVYEMRFNDSRAETVDEYAMADVRYERTFADDLQLMARGNFNYYLYEGDYPYEDEDEETERVPANSPRHLAKLQLRAPLLDQRLQAGVELLYTDDRKTVYGSSVDDALITNLTLYSHGLCDGLDLSASVYNLFDTALTDPGSLDHLQDGRASRLTASDRFCP